MVGVASLGLVPRLLTDVRRFGNDSGGKCHGCHLSIDVVGSRGGMFGNGLALGTGECIVQNGGEGALRIGLVGCPGCCGGVFGLKIRYGFLDSSSFLLCGGGLMGVVGCLMGALGWLCWLANGWCWCRSKETSRRSWCCGAE